MGASKKKTMGSAHFLEVQFFRAHDPTIPIGESILRFQKQIANSLFSNFENLYPKGKWESIRNLNLKFNKNVGSC